MAATADIIELPLGTLSAARMSADELKLELAIHLFSQRKLSEGTAREISGLSLWQFRHLLAARGIGPHLTPADVDKDLATLRKLGRL